MNSLQRLVVVSLLSFSFQCSSNRNYGDLGNPCAAGSDCDSEACVDGVCCDKPCAGPCESCIGSLTGLETGACGPVLADNDPRDQCADTGAASCGTTGKCDGAGTCALYAAGVECAAATCSAGEQAAASLCNGQGSCVDGEIKLCAPFVCGAAACLAMCASDADCIEGNVCVGGRCGDKKQQGEACAEAKQCFSGFCADGVCCNQACADACEACTAQKKGAGADGACGDVAANTDPDEECAAQAVSTCGRTGVCSGAGTCAFYAAGTVCATASCAGSEATMADTCDGAGQCVDKGTVNCAPYLCAGDGCATSCATSAGCVSTHYCAGGVCQGKSAMGMKCTLSEQCMTGFCVDGYCCNTACMGTCEACSNAYKGGGNNGVCGPIEYGDPQDECPGFDLCCVGVCKQQGICVP